MKKRFFFCVAVLMSVLSMQAEEHTWFGYWNSVMGTGESVACHDGNNTFGVRLLGNRAAQLLGGNAHGLRFWFSDKTAVQRAWVWLSSATFAWGTTDPDKLLLEVPVGQLKDLTHDAAPTEVRFDAPVALLPNNPYANVYAGYVLQVQGSAQTPCRALTAGLCPTAAAYSCLVDWVQQESSYGPLALQLLVSSDRIGSNGVTVAPPDEALVMAGQTYSTRVAFTTDGYAAVQSIGCRVTIDGQDCPVQHFTLAEPLAELGATFTLPVNIDLPAEPRLYNCDITVKEVNGQPNTSTAGTQASVRLTALGQKGLKRTVMEELTGTWCPNCPRGMVGMELLEKLFGDRFIGVAIHGGSSTEPMRLAAYDGSSFVKGVSGRMGGRPSCAIDRTVECDPFGGVDGFYHFAVDQVVAEALQQTAVADIDVSAAWDKTLTAVTLTAVTTFRYSADESHYALMLVITADSLRGEGDDWLQVNNLMGHTDYDPELDAFVYGQRRMQLAYNHVPVWVDGVEQGIAGSIATPLQNGVAQSYVRRVDMSANKQVQDKNLLHAVAMLIDTRTGRIVNAAKAHVGGAASAITTRPAPVGRTTACYTLDGIRVETGQGRGLLIVRDADGVTRKMLRK